MSGRWKSKQDTVRRPSPRQFDPLGRGTGFGKIELTCRRVLETSFVDFAVDAIVFDNRYFPHPAPAIASLSKGGKSNPATFLERRWFQV